MNQLIIIVILFVRRINSLILPEHFFEEKYRKDLDFLHTIPIFKSFDDYEIEQI